MNEAIYLYYLYTCIIVYCIEYELFLQWIHLCYVITCASIIITYYPSNISTFSYFIILIGSHFCAFESYLISKTYTFLIQQPK